MFRNKGILFVVVCIGILLVYRIGIRSITDIQMDKIEIASSLEGLKNMPDMLHNEQKATIEENPSQFRWIKYHFTVKNLSQKTNITSVEVYPLYPKELSDRVVVFDKSWIAAPIQLKPTQTGEGTKWMIINSDGYTDDELKKVLSKTQFIGVGMTGNTGWDLGANFMKVKYK